MAQVYVQLFSPREKKILDEYKHLYGVKIDGSNKNYELDVVDAIITRINTTQKIYDFRDSLLGKIKQNCVNLFDDINFPKNSNFEQVFTETIFKNQVLLEKHISTTLMSTYFCKKICELQIDQSIYNIFNDPELRKIFIKPSAKLYFMKNASLEVRSHNESNKNRVSNALLELHRNELLVVNEVKDAVENIQSQLNEIIAFSVITTVLKLSQMKLLKSELRVEKIVLFSIDLFNAYMSWIYERVRLCHEVVNVNHKIRKAIFSQVAQTQTWLKQDNELLIIKETILKKKRFSKPIEILYKDIDLKHGVQFENSNEMEYFKKLIEIHIFFLAKKSIALVNQRIRLEFLRDGFYSKVASLIFEEENLMVNDELTKEIDVISSRLNDLKTTRNISNTEICAVSNELHHIINDFFKEIKDQSLHIKLQNPANNIQLQQQKRLSTLLNQICMELYRSLK